MRAVLIGTCGVMGILALGACDGNNPTGPSNNTAQVRIVANSGSQSFSPNPAHVGGQMIAWRNDHGQTHRIVANDESFDTGNLSPGATSMMIGIPAGGLNYHCSIHPTMVGAIGGSAGEAPPACTGPYCE